MFSGAGVEWRGRISSIRVVFLWHPGKNWDTETNWKSRDSKEFPAAILDSAKREASPKYTLNSLIQDDFIRNQQQNYRRNVDSQVYGVRFLSLLDSASILHINFLFSLGRCAKVLLQQGFVYFFLQGEVGVCGYNSSRFVPLVLLLLLLLLIEGFNLALGL